MFEKKRRTLHEEKMTREADVKKRLRCNRRRMVACKSDELKWFLPKRKREVQIPERLELRAWSEVRSLEQSK
jgi:hypothetical protein